jgi:transcriptional regulator with XRE-family HTH domain
MAQAGEKFSQRKLAKAAGVSLSEVSAILCGRRKPAPATLARLRRAITRLEREASEEAEYVREVLNAVKWHCRLIGIREFA